jgi:nucleotide-binding universal stress UspA family protein
MWDIMVNVGTLTEASPMVGGTLELARREGAFVTGLQIVAVDPTYLGTAEAVGILVAEEVDAEGRRDWWEALCSRHGVRGEWVALRGLYVAGLAQRSLLADLLVCTLPHGALDGPLTVREVTRVLFTGASPMLLVPEEWEGGLLAKRIAIAWNGSAEAARAVRAALPLLKHADEVLVLDGVHEGLRGVDPPALPLQTWLERHGVRVHWKHFEARPETGLALHYEAIAWRADLLVMGAWGRSRLSELVLGGATRWMLGHTRLPLLIAH